MKIDFVVAGTQKGGTSALHQHLAAHPAVQVPQSKELHFFDTEANFSAGAPDYGAYHSHFDWTVPGARRGESTPIYMYWRSVPERLWRYNPDLRIIVLLRDPARRALSHWRMERARGADTLDFADAVRLEPVRCETAAPLQHRVFSYVDRGYYCRQLQRIWAHFSRRQTLVLRHDEFVAAPGPVLSAVWDFLALDAPRDMAHLPAAPAFAPDSAAEAETLAHLREVFHAEVRELERLLGWDCSNWLRP